MRTANRSAHTPNPASATVPDVREYSFGSGQPAPYPACHSKLPEFDPRSLVLHRADAHWMVGDADSSRGRCSLWWNHIPTDSGNRIGLIGHYACVDDEAARVLLDVACDQLARHGCDRVVGPMDQNTWRDYRFVIEDDGRERFFLEPRIDLNGHAQFLGNGFFEVATYCSSMVDDLNVRIPSIRRARIRLRELGVSIRTLRSDDLENELLQIHSIVQSAFAANPFFVPLERAAFLAMYEPLRELMRDDFILVAEHDGKMVGFCFAIPDLLQQHRGESIDTLIVKTFAVRPERVYSGLGQVMLEDVHRRADQAGFRSAIHALVREVPHMQRIVRRYGNVFRRYALLGKDLAR